MASHSGLWRERSAVPTARLSNTSGAIAPLRSLTRLLAVTFTRPPGNSQTPCGASFTSDYFRYFRSSWADWQGTHELGLTAAREAGNRQAEAWVMTSLGHLYSELQQFDKAVWLRQEALALFREIGDSEGEGRALTGLGSGYIALGRFEEGIDCQEQALTICRRTAYPYRERVALEHLGIAYRAVRRFGEAIECYQGALVISRQIGYRLGEGNSLLLLGRALEHTRGMEDARACWEEALHVFHRARRPAGQRSACPPRKSLGADAGRLECTKQCRVQGQKSSPGHSA